MSTQRTPPKTLLLSANAGNLASKHCLSDPNLTIHSDSELSSNKTCLKRKRHYDTDINFDLLKTEMMEIFKNFSAEIGRQFSVLQSKIEDIKEQNTKLQESVDFNAAKYEEISKKLQQLQHDRKEDYKTIQSLEEKVEQLERQVRSTSLEIRNIPSKSHETKQELISTVVKLGNIVKSPIQFSDIKEVFSTKTKAQSKTIIVEYTTALTKEKMQKAIKTFNTENKNDKLNTTHFQMEGPKIPIYVSDNLTSKAKRLFYLARDFASQENYKYCWTSLGKILLRKQDGAPIIRIINEKDFLKLRTNEKQ